MISSGDELSLKYLVAHQSRPPNPIPTPTPFSAVPLSQTARSPGDSPTSAQKLIESPDDWRLMQVEGLDVSSQEKIHNHERRMKKKELKGFIYLLCL